MSRDRKTDFHVVPGSDTKEHEVSRNCWCKPVRDEEVLDLFVHNALDGRDRDYH